jgi:hypothetical protein
MRILRKLLEFNYNRENKMGETEEIVVKSIEAHVYKLSEEEQDDFAHCVHRIQFLIDDFGYPAQLALAWIGAKIAAKEEE